MRFIVLFSVMLMSCNVRNVDIPNTDTQQTAYPYAGPEFELLSDVTEENELRYRFIRETQTGACFIRMTGYGGSAQRAGLAPVPCEKLIRLQPSK